MENLQTSSFKDPVHQIVDTLPTSPTTGLRVILTTDPEKIYQWNGSEWETDSLVINGSMARVIGKDGSQGDIASFYNLLSAAKITTPFYPSGGAYVNKRVLVHNGQIYIFRCDNTNTDVIRYNPATKDSDQITSFTGKVFTDVCVDASGNIWIGFTTALVKVDATDVWSKETTYTTTNSTIPTNYIDRVVANGNDIWIFNNQSNAIIIGRLQDGAWTDMTDQLWTDTGIVEGTAGNITLYDVYVNESRVFFTLTGDGTWSGRLFYFSDTTEIFAVIALYNTYLPTKIVVLDNVLHSLSADGSVIKIQNILTGTTPAAADVLYTSPANIVANLLRVNGTTVYAVYSGIIYQLNASGTAYEVNEDMEAAIAGAISPVVIIDAVFDDTYSALIHQSGGVDDTYLISKVLGWDYFPRNGISKDNMRYGIIAAPKNADAISFTSPLGVSSHGEDLLCVQFKSLGSEGTEIASAWSQLTNSGFKYNQVAGTVAYLHYCFLKI